METGFVECVAASLVREYLSRKGLKETLASIDTELPRTPESISNRLELLKTLNIDKLVRKNKWSDSPLKSMVEVMTKYFLEKTSSRPSTASSRSQSLTDDIQVTCRDNMAHFDTNGLKYMKNSKDKQQCGDLLIEDDLESETVLGQGKSGLLNTRQNSADEMSSKSRQRGMSGPITSSVENRDKHRRPGPSRPVSSRPVNRPVTDTNTVDIGSSLTVKHLQNDTPAVVKADSSNQNSAISSDQRSRPTPMPRRGAPVLKNKYSQPADFENEDYSTSSLSKQSVTKCAPKGDIVEAKVSTSIKESSRNQTAPERNTTTKKPTAKPASAMTKVGDIEIGDIDDLDEDLAALEVTSKYMYRPNKTPTMITDSKPIDIQTAVELKTLIFGTASMTFNPEWFNQGFAFCDIPHLQYGIVQKKGGPCGVLAVIQSYTLKHLLFQSDVKPTVNSLYQTKNKRTAALAEALCEILWRAGDEKKAVVALPSGRSNFIGNGRYKPDNLTETLVLNHLKKYEDLQMFLKQSISQFENDSGVVLMLYSAILSRTIAGVKSDMDEAEGKLMGAHGYCTQDMVNLLLTGKAVSNVFNDVITLEAGPGEKPMILSGISKRCDVGLLSLFEHYKSCQVGTCLKTPKYPIWIICSESHFSVLFSLKRELLGDWRVERRFDLYYYDGLGKQDEEIKLTIDTTSKSYTAPTDDDLVPPIELCIRTKWKDAEVDWNSTEPLL